MASSVMWPALRPLLGAAFAALVAGAAGVDIDLASGGPLGGTAGPPGQTSLREYRLGRVEVVGLKQVPRARVLAIAALREGTTVTQRDAEAASARLVDSGLFSSVTLQYRMEGYNLVVTFEVEEAEWTTPVVFDNFIGYTDEQLSKAVAAGLPPFNGSAPESPVILAKIAAALQTLVRASDPAATVSYISVPESRTAPQRYRFTADIPGRRNRICKVAIEGMPEDQAPEAVSKEASLVGTDYSRDFVAEHAATNVLPIAHRDGRYKAKVTGVSARAAVPAGECGESVEVTIQIAPGLRYTWSNVEWTGAGVLSGADIAKAIRIAGGEPADVSMLAEGLTALKSMYHRRGYMAVRLLPVETVDEAARTVACKLMVMEGPRFRFRSVEVVGLEPELATRIRSRWTLAPGEFYDATYTRAFVSEARKLEREALAGRTNVAIREKPDAATTSVDIILEFGRAGGPSNGAAGDQSLLRERQPGLAVRPRWAEMTGRGAAVTAVERLAGHVVISSLH